MGTAAFLKRRNEYKKRAQYQCRDGHVLNLSACSASLVSSILSSDMPSNAAAMMAGIDISAWFVVHGTAVGWPRARDTRTCMYAYT